MALSYIIVFQLCSTMEPVDVMKKYAVQLLTLPVQEPDFKAILKSEGLLFGDLGERVELKHLTKKGAAQLFVDEIERTLVISRDSYDKLIHAMKKYKNEMDTLATQMECDTKSKQAGTNACIYCTA